MTCTRHAAGHVDALRFVLTPPDLERREVDILAAPLPDTVAHSCVAERWQASDELVKVGPGPGPRPVGQPDRVVHVRI